MTGDDAAHITLAERNGRIHADLTVKGRGQWKKDLLPILETLAALGRARANGDLWHNG